MKNALFSSFVRCFASLFFLRVAPQPPTHTHTWSYFGGDDDSPRNITSKQHNFVLFMFTSSLSCKNLNLLDLCFKILPT